MSDLVLVARWAFAAAALVAALAVALPPRKRGGRRSAPRPPAFAPPARPSREGLAETAALLGSTGASVLARERVAARAAALAREAVALRLGVDSEAARALMRSGALEDAPALRLFIERDYLAGPGPGRRRPAWGRSASGRPASGRLAPARDEAEALRLFLEETEDALNDIDELRGARRKDR